MIVKIPGRPDGETSLSRIGGQYMEQEREGPAFLLSKLWRYGQMENFQAAVGVHLLPDVYKRQQ